MKTTNDIIQRYFDIERVDEERREVSGYFFTEESAGDGWTIMRSAMEEATRDYMDMPSVRQMHTPSLGIAGKALNVEWKPSGGYVTAKIVDDQAWEKVKENVYRGFSIGAKAIKRSGSKVTKVRLMEISLVDLPQDYGCKFDLFRAEDFTNEPNEALPDEKVSEMTGTDEYLPGTGEIKVDGFGETEEIPSDSKPTLDPNFDNLETVPFSENLTKLFEEFRQKFLGLIPKEFVQQVEEDKETFEPGEVAASEGEDEGTSGRIGYEENEDNIEATLHESQTDLPEGPMKEECSITEDPMAVQRDEDGFTDIERSELLEKINKLQADLEIVTGENVSLKDTLVRVESKVTELENQPSRTAPVLFPDATKPKVQVEKPRDEEARLRLAAQLNKEKNS